MANKKTVVAEIEIAATKIPPSAASPKLVGLIYNQIMESEHKIHITNDP